MQNAVVQNAEALLGQVFKFIEANYHQSIGLNDVAQAVGYSPAYLTDLVRRQTGQPVHGWIIERRLTEACRLLRETTDSASQIAEITGYQTAGYFFRQFRQRYGTTPQAWRKIQQIKMQSSDLDRAAHA
ncbi:helix-turn-helix transcriptional regulator [Phormidium sp. FACHB-592]|uniref:AraC family transcriptional regulator n=1 Tax=Stenomitos frigidus AS-A4 TaxID=2933935 RepID=A0ABV0KSJ5_9CYAN|nr:AraC family transcriptional regulator [Phormidium sp. FACHB-592]MBD2077174.1 helix-turn-helix transcriptional regulator [Phormidium sp. FACHB-592]